MATQHQMLGAYCCPHWIYQMFPLVIDAAALSVDPLLPSFFASPIRVRCPSCKGGWVKFLLPQVKVVCAI